ncbi:MAG: transposase [Bacteroidota bacterium]
MKLVMDHLNKHSHSSFHEAFSVTQAKEVWNRFEFIYTPKHGNWLNMVEIEINVLNHQCFIRRIEDIETVKSEVEARCRD